MGFSDQIKAFAEQAKSSLELKKAEVEANARKVLSELLGEEVSKIESISLNSDTGKFHSVVAPESIIQKLKDANLWDAK
ncbi:hypothetical protein [Stutzerimonas nitrititolerans]|uniref:hypothetical protein n=1 Tax=Stutzerimonas nitrititolerans TaxID=2482751 RepID=UPI001111F5D4|nr:hypothetical protein [Stutzerimonas nitrititolerans]